MSLKKRYAAMKSNLASTTISVHKTSKRDTIEAIDCQTLYEKITKGASSKYLLIDFRSEADFRRSTIDFKNIVNLPKSILTAGTKSEQIITKLPDSESKFVWAKRDGHRFYVIFDSSSPSSSLITLFKKITGQDVKNEGNLAEILTLDGGFARWKNLYPMKCTN
jgi:hypothetical protein